MNDFDLKSHLPRLDDGLIEVTVPKTNNILGIAIEGGVDTRHRLPRIISIDVITALISSITYLYLSRLPCFPKVHSPFRARGQRSRRPDCG